ncbi:MAG: transposase [Verrucomicrobiaceae bacterium]|nr:MAG: transposase [Verrucomicrobiaceae bacterium]
MKIAQYPTCVSDFQWHVLSSMLPKARRLGRPRTCLRRVLNAVLFVLKSGRPWRLLPKDFPAWKTVYHHFRSWSRSGILVAINARLRKMVRRLDGRSNNPSAHARQVSGARVPTQARLPQVPAVSLRRPGELPSLAPGCRRASAYLLVRYCCYDKRKRQNYSDVWEVLA